jgi:hypothetical protein
MLAYCNCRLWGEGLTLNPPLGIPEMWPGPRKSKFAVLGPPISNNVTNTDEAAAKFPELSQQDPDSADSHYPGDF